MFGPTYPKINTLWKRDKKNIVVLGDWSCEEFQFLRAVPWRWTEKIDGTNIRIHWDGGHTVTVGGRSDNADVPQQLLDNLMMADLLNPNVWDCVFGTGNPATVYGEGYGAKIQSGGQYRPDQSFIVFDVLVGNWWLQPAAVQDVASNLGFDVVPFVGEFTPAVAWYRTTHGAYESQWSGAHVEGLVGRPVVDLYNRRGERILAKVKVKDWTQFTRAQT